MTTPCPDDAELAAFLDGSSASPSERARIVAHFDECASCRRLAGDAAAAAATPTATQQNDTRRRAPLIAPLRAGDAIGGKYVIRRLLGRGGWGSVFEAEQLDLKRVVAIKMLDSGTDENHDDADANMRFHREAFATARIDHPNVAAIFDFVSGSASSSAFIVMERLEGETLAQLLLREEKLPLPRALAITTQMLRGLEAAHAMGVVHRDVKPANIFVLAETAGEREIRIKLLDFGVAKVNVTSWRTTTGEIMGTPAYMAPEQLLAASVNARTDLYAVAVTLTEMLTGKRLHHSEDRATNIANILSDAPRVADTGNTDVDAVIAKAADRSLSKRYASAREMREALEEVLPRSDAPRLSSSPREKKLRPPRPPRRNVFAIAVLLTLGLGAAAFVAVTIHSVMTGDAFPAPVVPSASASSSPSSRQRQEDTEPPSDREEEEEEEEKAIVVVDGSSAAPPPTVTAPRTCICTVWEGALCTTPEPAACRCISNESLDLGLCMNQLVDGNCPAGFYTYSDPAAAVAAKKPAVKDGDACMGYNRGQLPPNFDRVVGIETAGHIECTVCRAPTAPSQRVAGKHGATCKGTNAKGQSIAGTLDCKTATKRR